MAKIVDDSGVTRVEGTIDLEGDSLTVAGNTTVEALEINGALNHDGTTVGFYNTTPVAKQTGVAVTAAGIHAALVNLGLIAA